MADNFLERQMEAYREGVKVVRMQGRPLDGLLRKLGEPFDGYSFSEPVKQAQLDAAVRSASYTGDDFTFVASEQTQSIVVEMTDASESSLLRLGGIVMAVRLKAEELGLKTVTSHNEGEPSAEIKFYKNQFKTGSKL